MLINPNLLDITKTTHQNALYDFNTKIARVLNNYRFSRVQFELPDDLEVGKEYTFSCKIDNIDGDSELSVVAYPKTVIAGTFIADKGIQSYAFTLNDKNTHIYLYLGDRVKGTYGSYKIYNVKLEKGDKATPYIPNINTLPEDKQPLLPPEGRYNEITPL